MSTTFLSKAWLMAAATVDYVTLCTCHTRATAEFSMDHLAPGAGSLKFSNVFVFIKTKWIL